MKILQKIVIILMLVSLVGASAAIWIANLIG